MFNQNQCENLRQHVELLNEELSNKDEAIKAVQQQLNMCEDDLVRKYNLIDQSKFSLHFLKIFQASTRLTYEEQISVMTEQLISLSEQLAATT